MRAALPRTDGSLPRLTRRAARCGSHALESEHAKDISKACRELLQKMPQERRDTTSSLLTAHQRKLFLAQLAKQVSREDVGRGAHPEQDNTAPPPEPEAAALHNVWLGVVLEAQQRAGRIESHAAQINELILAPVAEHIKELDGWR